MSTKSEFMKEWIKEASNRFGIPEPVAEAIFNSQLSFIREVITDPIEPRNIHITNLGKFFTRDSYLRKDGKPARNFGRMEEPSN